MTEDPLDGSELLPVRVLPVRDEDAEFLGRAVAWLDPLARADRLALMVRGAPGLPSLTVWAGAGDTDRYRVPAPEAAIPTGDDPEARARAGPALLSELRRAAGSLAVAVPAPLRAPPVQLWARLIEATEVLPERVARAARMVGAWPALMDAAAWLTAERARASEPPESLRRGVEALTTFALGFPRPLVLRSLAEVHEALGPGPLLDQVAAARALVGPGPAPRALHRVLRAPAPRVGATLHVEMPGVRILVSGSHVVVAEAVGTPLVRAVVRGLVP